MIKTISSLNTEYPPDSVEVSPNDPDYFACGTYQLLEQTDGHRRVGNIRLYKYKQSDEEPVKCQQVVDMAAVFELRWCRHRIRNKSLLGVASTDGHLIFHEFRQHCDVFELQEMSRVKLNGQNILACSLDWSTNLHPSNDPQVVVSDSSGQLSLFTVSDEGIKIGVNWKGHDAESWVVAFDSSNPCTIYSGGDDCKFKIWDVRTCARPTSVIRRHEMGVTSIQDNVQRPSYLATGSYDENLLIWDKRQMKSPVSTTALGGGIWTIKWNPDDGDRILAACMHNGFHIVDFKASEDGGQKILLSYKNHSSLAYGCDWFPSSGSNLVVTCSFYDKQLDVWKFD